MQTSNGPMSQDQCFLYCKDKLDNTNLKMSGLQPEWQCKLNNNIIESGSF